MIERVLRRAMRLSPKETSFERRGFNVESAMAKERLEAVGLWFVSGYNEALRVDSILALGAALQQVPGTERGFACEGAAMALTLLDLLLPRSASRLRSLLEGPGAAHPHLVHVGIGWALARLGRGEAAIPPVGERLLRPLAIDGHGFHDGYFDPRRAFGRRHRPSRFTGYALRLYDQGLGRSLWFVTGASPRRAAGMIGDMPEARRSDLWSGLGLAATYAGGASESDFRLLRDLAGPYTSHVAQGAAFAARARGAATDPPVEHTERACRLFCGCSAAEAARVTDDEQVGLESRPDEPAYELWRRRTRARLTEGILLR